MSTISRRMVQVAAALVPVAALFTAVWIAAPAQAAVCPGRVASDFNGDGVADLAAGEPVRNGGAVRVLYGTSSGPTATGNQYFDRATPGMLDILGQGDFNSEHSLGMALTTGFFNDDCFADLAAGGPGTNRVLVLYGSSDGLSLNGGMRFTQADLGITGSVIGFGTAVSAGDVNGDGFDDLAIGQPNTTTGGAFAVVYGSAAGLSTTGSQVFTQDTAGIPGGGEPGDLLGQSLVLADFTGDGRADLAAGLPGEATIPRDAAGHAIHNGAVLVVRGSAAGLTASGSKLWTQNTTGVPGGAEYIDTFGWSLAAGDLDRDGRADLAIGSPGEAIGALDDAGSITVLRGASAGLTATGAVAFSQDSASIPGAAETFDRFGESVTFGDFNGDRYADLVASAPGEDIGSAGDTGLVIVIYSKHTALTGAGAKSFSQDSAGVPGASEAGDRWGAAVGRLASRPAVADRLMVGATGEDVGSINTAGAITVLQGGTSGLTGSGGLGFNGSGLVNGAAEDGQLGTAVA
jgi:hypothetical protein